MFFKYVVLAGALQAALALNIPRIDKNGAVVVARAPIQAPEIRADSHNSTDLESSLVARGNPGGTVTVVNRCDYDIWLQSVDPFYNSGTIHVKSRTKWTEPKRAPDNAGVSVKVSRSLDIGAKITQFEYTIDKNIMYYDISFVDCARVGSPGQWCPGWKTGLAIKSTNGHCQTVECAPGVHCNNIYWEPQPRPTEPVFGCGNAGVGMDLFFIMCNSKPQL